MTSPSKAARSRAKTGQSAFVHPKPGSVPPISAVMQKVQGLLPAKKAPVAMHLATDLSIDLCKKLLCGERRETAATLEALLRSDLGREVLFALMGDARPDWFIKYSRQLDIYAAQQQLDQSTKAIAALQAGLSK